MSGGAASPAAGREILSLEAFDAGLTPPAEVDVDVWAPTFVRLAPGEAAALEALCRARGLRRVDTIDRQLLELAGARDAASDADARRSFADAAVEAAGDAGAVGAWIHFPWRGTVVHVLDEDDFLDVITDRNRDKITREEQRFLRTRRVGVMGLSVGGEAAVTVAQEHLCGHVVLADFDSLDLSNLNRLNAGVDDLGVNKAVLVARRIALVDPWLRVTVHPGGVTDGNVDDFLDGLDLLLEECDGLPMKHRIRALAMERGLDVTYGGDERGFLSVEPYGRWPELELFHGRVEGPQKPREAYPDAASFWRDLTEWLGGWDAISERSRTSLEAVGTRLGGYPQLAGEARFAAGQVAHVARRLLLGERLRPWIGHVDLEAILPTEGAFGAPPRGGSTGGLPATAEPPGGPR